MKVELTRFRIKKGKETKAQEWSSFQWSRWPTFNNAMKKDVFWFNQDKWNDSIPTIIITEKYRMSEYERSEYFNQNSESKIIPMGTFHYIQWEYPHEISDILISLSK